MAVGYYRLISPSMNAQAVCTLFEAEANVTSCTVAGVTPETSTDPIVSDQAQITTLTIDATGGTFDLGFSGDMEEDIAEDANSATIQAALRALDSGSATLTVTGDGPHVITLTTADPDLVADGTALTGGAGTAVLVDSQSSRDPGVLVFPNQVVFKVIGTTVAAITDAATALIAAEDDAGDSNAGANVEVASGYPAVAI